MKINVKREKGFTSVDLGIAMIVVIIFVSIMTSMIYSVYLSSTEAKRTAMAVNYAVDIFEEIGREDYNSIYAEGVFRNLTQLDIKSIKSTTSGTKQATTGEIGTYKLSLEVTEPYTDHTIKKFKLTITYPVSAKNTETLEMERIRTIKKT